MPRKLSNLVFLVIAITLISIQSALEDKLFIKYEKFIKKYKKTYETFDEMTKRFEIFKENCQKFNLTDTDDLFDRKSDEEMVYGVTEFMDLTQEEFQSQYLTLKNEKIPGNATPYFTNETHTFEGRMLQENLPNYWNWEDHGVVGHVKNQGSCGGCWAFSALANIEGQFARKYGKIPTLSNQQLIDCDPYNSGCLGGIIINAYHYILEYGVMEAKDYLYQGFRGKCKYDNSKTNYRIGGYVYSGTDNEERIKVMLYKYGPLAVTLNARNLQFYNGGVINWPYEWCPYSPTHGVLLIGWGTTPSGLDYWIVRNTWGPNWGENGNFRIARGRGLCGINQYVVSAVLK